MSLIKEPSQAIPISEQSAVQEQQLRFNITGQVRVPRSIEPAKSIFKLVKVLPDEVRGLNRIEAEYNGTVYVDLLDEIIEGMDSYDVDVLLRDRARKVLIVITNFNERPPEEKGRIINAYDKIQDEIEDHAFMPNLGTVSIPPDVAEYMALQTNGDNRVLFEKYSSK